MHDSPFFDGLARRRARGISQDHCRRTDRQWRQPAEELVVHLPGAGSDPLSAAYDIVPTILYARNDTLALPLVGTHSFECVTFRRIRRIAAYLGLDPDWIDTEMRALIRKAIPLWPEILTR